MLTELTDYAFAAGGPVQRVLGQHRPDQATIAHDFAAMVEGQRNANHTTVALSEQRGGLGKTAAYTVVLLLDIALSGERAAYATFTRALRDSIKDMSLPFNRIVQETLTANGHVYQPVSIVEYQSPTAFISPTKCDAIRTRLAQRLIPPDETLEVQDFLDCVDASEHPCEFADLYAVVPTLPCGWSELTLCLCPQDRDTDDWRSVQRQREQATNDHTLILLTHAMVIRNNLRNGRLFYDDTIEDPIAVKTLVIDEADKLPAVANAALRVTVSRNELITLLDDVRVHLDDTLRAEGERILARGLDQLNDAVTQVNISLHKTDPSALRISSVLNGINHGLGALFRIAVANDALIAERLKLCRDNVRTLAMLDSFEHPILRIAVVRDVAGQPDITLTLEIGGGRRLISQMWRNGQFETITMASALMTNMPPFATRYDRFCRDIDLDRTQGDHIIERSPLQPYYGDINNVFVTDRLPSLLPTDASEANLLRQTSLDGLAAQITSAAHRRRAGERTVVLFQSYIAMTEVFARLADDIQTRVVTRNRRHLSDAMEDFANRRFGIWFGVEWEGINFVHPSTRRTMVTALIITRLPLAPRDEIRVIRLGQAFDNARAAEGIALFEAVHSAYRKLYHGVLLGIRNQRDVIDELWILDPRWPLPAYIYQRQPPQIIRSINGGLFNYFDRIIEPYVINRWFKVDAAGEITQLIALEDAA
jgi:hypothetical protein